jgi:molybdenum cofactor synthesis domain-containing protein
MVERSVVRDGTVTFDGQIAPGMGIRPPGDDFAAGELVVASGTVLSPARIGLAASVGAALVSVHPRPRVAVLSTGDELVPVTSVPGPGQIRDSNRYALMAAVEEAGGIPIDGGHVPDSESATEALALLSRAADAVVTSGGVSMGHRDLVKPWLAANGEILFGRVRMKPGKPATFALVDGCPFFALPGFPVSALVTFELLVRPAIRAMAGDRNPSRPEWSVRLESDVPHDPKRVEFVRGIVTLGEGGPVARTTGAQGSGRLLSMAPANALVRLDQEASLMPAGSRVPALIIGDVAA